MRWDSFCSSPWISCHEVIILKILFVSSWGLSALIGHGLQLGGIIYHCHLWRALHFSFDLWQVWDCWVVWAIVNVLVWVAQVEKYWLPSLHVLFRSWSILNLIHLFKHDEILFLNFALPRLFIVPEGPQSIVDHPLSQLLIYQCLRRPFPCA